jgi:hypothetical protein
LRIRISGAAAAHRTADDAAVADAAVLRQLDGRGYEEDACSRYLDPSLDRIGLIEGYVRLACDEAGSLRVVTEYGSPRLLKPAELKRLTEETVAQWSDGIGEGGWTHFEDLGVWVDLFPDGQAATLETTQWDDGVKVKPPRKSPLLAAAAGGNLDKVRKLLDEGEPPDPIDKDGWRPIDHALYRGHLEVARLLIDRGASLAPRGPTEFSPLTNAVIRGHPEIVRLMLERGALPNGRASAGEAVDYFPLLMAANRGQLEAARVLLEFGADVNQRDRNGYTPLLMVSDKGVEMARLLLRHGADPDARNDFCKPNAALLKAAREAGPGDE